MAVTTIAIVGSLQWLLPVCDSEAQRLLRDHTLGL